jgi:hypothetical protein
MGMICSAAAELKIQTPGGGIEITVVGPSLTSKGQVIVHGSEPLAKFRWYRDMLSQARNALRYGRWSWSPKSECYVIRCKDVVLQTNEVPLNKTFFRTLLWAALDVVNRDREPEKPTAIECPAGGSVRLGNYNFTV